MKEDDASTVRAAWKSYLTSIRLLCKLFLQLHLAKSALLYAMYEVASVLLENTLVSFQSIKVRRAISICPWVSMTYWTIRRTNVWYIC
jgi:hypothetical protein